MSSIIFVCPTRISRDQEFHEYISIRQYLERKQIHGFSVYHDDYRVEFKTVGEYIDQYLNNPEMFINTTIVFRNIPHDLYEQIIRMVQIPNTYIMEKSNARFKS